MPPPNDDAAQLFALSLDLLCVASVDGRIRRVNAAFEQILGWTSEELLSRPYLDFVHPDDGEPTAAALAAIAAGAVVGPLEIRFRCKDDSFRWLSWRSAPPDAHGLFYAVARDVTEQHRTAAALHASERRYRTLIEQSPLSVVIFDPSGRPIASNAAFERLTGSSLDTLPEGYTAFTDPQLARAGVMELTTRAFAGETVNFPPLSYDVAAMGGGVGRRTWLQSTSYPILDDAGTVEQVVLVTADITEQMDGESARHALDERFRIVQDASPDAFVIWEAVRETDDRVTDFVLGYANLAFERTFQRKVAELRGRSMSEFFPYARSSGRFADYAHVLETGEATERVVKYEVDGRWLRVTTVRVGEGIAITMSDITARIEAEQVLRRSREELEGVVEERTRELREREERFRSLTENSLDVISILAPDGSVLYGGQAYEKVFGYPLQDVLGTNVFRLVHPDDRESTLVVFQELIEHPDETRTTEFRVVRPDGVAVWVQAFGQNRLADPAVRGIVINSRDITAQRTEAEAKGRAKAMFRGLAQQAITGSYIGQDGRVIYGNPEFARIFGYTVDELLTLPGQFDLIAPEERARVQEVVSQRLASGGDVRYTTVGIRKDGSRVPIEVYGSSLELDGRPASVATVLDISDRVRAEAALRESEERFDLAVAGTSDGIWDWDLAANHLYLSPRWKAQLGYQDHELGTTGAEWEGRVHPDDLANARAYIADYFAGRVERFELEHRLRHRDGSYRWMLARAAAVRDEAGHPLRLVGANTDRTERKQLEESIAEQARELAQRNAQLARQSLELQRSNEELERFAYAASHDLQEPLRMVTSFTGLLAKQYEGQLDDRAQEYIHFARDGALRMKRLIQDLLDYSRVGSRGAELEPIDSEAALADAVRNLEVAVHESGAAITSDPLPAVCADASQLAQVFQNLVGNALKFRGTATPSIHVSVTRDGEMWRFSVRDNGMGIERRHAERIFIMFQRLHTRAEYPGTGIGLALCRRIIERHNGRIWVESTPGEGATFHFTLPSAAPSGESASEHP